MSVEVYSLSVDFPGGLNSGQLLNEILVDPAITPAVCDRVDTDDDQVLIYFDLVLTAGEKTALDTLVSNYVYVANLTILSEDIFRFSHIEINSLRMQKIGFITTGATTQTLGNFTTNSGTLGDWDNGTGTFSIAEDGVYSFNCFIGANTANNTKIKVRFFDGAITRYAETGDLNDQCTEYVGGGMSFSYMCQFFVGESVQLQVELASNDNLDCYLSILRPFTSA
jgi:hypothetical protein